MHQTTSRLTPEYGDSWRAASSFCRFPKKSDQPSCQLPCALELLLAAGICDHKQIMKFEIDVPEVSAANCTALTAEGQRQPLGLTASPEHSRADDKTPALEKPRHLFRQLGLHWTPP